MARIQRLNEVKEMTNKRESSLLCKPEEIMNPKPNPHLSRLCSTEPDIDLSQWQRLADYLGGSFSTVSGSEQSLRAKKVRQSLWQGIMALVGITTILLLGSALWYHSHQSYQSSRIIKEQIKIQYAPTFETL